MLAGHMQQHILLLHCPEGTKLARERFLASMDTIVAAEVTQLPESLLAKRTVIQPVQGLEIAL